MKIYPTHILFVFIIFLFITCSTEPSYNVSWMVPAEKNVNNTIDGISFESGDWEELRYNEPARSLGNHRAVISAPPGAEAVWLHLPWRRRDTDVNQKRVIIIDQQSADTVQNMILRQINDEFADIIFQPVTGAESYYVYYFPFQTTGGYYPTVNYMTPKTTGDPVWLQKYDNLRESEFSNLPAATVSVIQSINDFHSFFPMELSSTKAEVDSFTRKYPKDYYLFPEYRENPVKMNGKIPYHWMERGYRNGISDEVLRGEFYTFQIATFSPNMELKNLTLTYSDLRSGSMFISKDQIQCINTDGVDLNGIAFSKNVTVPENSIQPLWFGVKIPEDLNPATYSGMVIIKPEGLDSDTVHLKLDVTEGVAKDHGDDNPEKMSRLRWLNSTLGSEDDFIISPFTPVETEGKNLKVLGRKIELDASGLPGDIQSYFQEEMTGLKEDPESVISNPIQFQIENQNRPVEWSNSSFEINKPSPARAEWSTINTSTDFEMHVEGTLEYDGMLNYELTIIAKNDINVQDMKLEVPMSANASKYILGLGFKGSSRPQTVDWKWDITKHHEGVWLGNVNKGMQYVLRDKNYQRPLNTNFYQNQPLNLPPSWYNDGKGGIRISQVGETVLCENYSGPRSLQKGDTLNFYIRFLITPFKPIDTKTHFNTRFVHKYVPVDSVRELGGTVVNVHHANEINPFINYPFYNLDLQKNYIDEAHRKGIKVKLYNTIRELTFKSYELYPMRSLGFEIFNDGEGGGHPWLQEHLEADYHKAWHAWRVNDAAILNKGTSRWTNYYIEGLNWLAKNQEIDGLYLDDIAFSRETVKRMVAVLNRHRENVIIDLHSANQYNPRDGFINSAFLYMEHFPYISRLWFGEYFEYDQDPDYWFTEVSGIPFGLTGEMLQDGGHPYRGMVYGMTTRVYGKYNPQAIWKLFDDFGIMDSEMIGCWVGSVPVKSNNPKVLVTVYKKDKEVLLAFGSWSDKDELVNLEIDWGQLPLIDPDIAVWQIPGVEGLQEERILEKGKPVIIPRNQGLFIIIKST